MHILADLQEHTGHARVLTDGNLLPAGDFVIFYDVVQDIRGDGAVLLGAAGLNGPFHVSGQVDVGLNAQPFHGIGDPADVNFTHSCSSLLFGGCGSRCGIRNRIVPQAGGGCTVVFHGSEEAFDIFRRKRYTATKRFRRKKEKLWSRRENRA